jgi:malonyl-CoA/methylmalonyl-CoA synthetase
VAPLAAGCGARLFTLDADGGGSLAVAAAAQQSLADVVPRADDDLAAILYTSGTTGRSKGAMLSHGNLWSNVATLHRAWGFGPDDVLIHALPLYHTHGLFVALNLMLMNGGRMILLPRFDAGQVVGLMDRATVLMGVPTFYARLLAEPGLTREAVAGMRLFVSGSAPLLAATHAAFGARTGQRILERYGMTETCMNASNPLDGDRRAGTVGTALPGISLRVCGADGAVLPAGEVGVLEVKGPNVFKGYWNMPEKTAEEFRDDGYFVTGDLARIGADGYVTIVGRSKDLIITGGLNVYPKEVEAAIDALPGVAESAVIGVPHPDFGEAVVAAVVADGSPGDVVGALRDRLVAF